MKVNDDDGDDAGCYADAISFLFQMLRKSKGTQPVNNFAICSYQITNEELLLVSVVILYQSLQSQTLISCVWLSLFEHVKLS